MEFRESELPEHNAKLCGERVCASGGELPVCSGHSVGLGALFSHSPVSNDLPSTHSLAWGIQTRVRPSSLVSESRGARSHVTGW